MEHDFPLKKGPTFVMAVFHLGAFAAFFFVTWHRVLLGLSVEAIVSTFGVGVCYHRLLTHQGFKTSRAFEYALATIASLAQQGMAVAWVAIHRVHHRYTEEEGMDPHTPRDGHWWSHMDWMIHPDPKLQNKTFLHKWVPDLIKHSFYRKRFVEWLPSAVLAVVCLLAGGVPTLLWGVTVPVVVGWHKTWLVNSATHIWGSRRFATDDDSRNLWWVGVLAWGEGWHNNHHYDPTRARHGLAWYELDINWCIIWCLEKIGLVWSVKNDAKD